MPIPNSLLLAGAGTTDIVSLRTVVPYAPNQAGVLTSLDVYDLPANVLANDGDSLDFEYCGTFNTGDDDVHLKLMFGSDPIVDVSGLEPTDGCWLIAGRVTRLNSSDQLFWATQTDQEDRVLVADATTQNVLEPIRIELFGGATSANTVRLYSAMITFRAA